MIIGNTSTFAIESGITNAYASHSLRALGFFLIYVGGRCYGRRSSDSTMLACSFDEVRDRIAHRGEHIAHFASGFSAGTIADAVRRALYAQDQESERFLGMRQAELSELIYARHILWAPDGDEAFDDGSFVLQFDVEDRVRLIAFKRDEAYSYDPTTLREMWLAGDSFYLILQQWYDAFETEWLAMSKGTFYFNGE
jgi:hypothetical protein